MKKKLIEVALPLEAINVASAREKSIRHGHPSTLHLWWARRPLAAARAVIFAQMVDDPSSLPDLFPTEKAQERERQRLFRIIEDLVKWENTTNEQVLQRARDEIWQSWRRACAENADHPRAKELFDRHKLPAFHDPFAGGGSLPLEAQRLGLEAYASDLNPVAVLINKAMIEIPPKFAGRPPVNPEWQAKSAEEKATHEWSGAQGLADDVRYYGKWMRDEAEKRIGHLYPKIEITDEMVAERADLRPYLGKELTVIAWLWARTVKSPNPAFAEVAVPLASTFMLSTKAGKEAYIEPVIEGGGYRLTVKVGTPDDPAVARAGTKLGTHGADFQCLLSGTPVTGDYIKAEAQAGRLGARMMAIVAEGDRERVYLEPTASHVAAAQQAKPQWKPEVEFFQGALGFRIGNYGMERWSDLFSARQLCALDTFSSLVGEVQLVSERAAAEASHGDNGWQVAEARAAAQSYGAALRTYLAFAVDKGANYWSSLCAWHQTRSGIVSTFGRPTLPIVWDYAEANPLSGSSGNVLLGAQQAAEMLQMLGLGVPGIAHQADAGTQMASTGKVVATDPPYYDNIGYADLSDFFYVWLRRSLRSAYPELLATVAVPKGEELVATPARHGGKRAAEAFFLDGMTAAMGRLAEQAHPAFPLSIFYAFRQAETNPTDGTTNTGWDTFLAAVIRAGLSISGAWPVRTEYGNKEGSRNALATSIVLVCRRRPGDAPTATRREFVAALQRELPEALRHLQAGNIAPVDLAQAAIGPGMAVFTRYAKVLDAEGQPVSVRNALALINETLDTALAEQEGDFDGDTRWALAWFEQYGFDEGEFGVAETLSKAKNTSVEGMVQAGIVAAGSGKVRLLKPGELPTDWDPTKDKRLTVWETVHHLVRVLEAGGEGAAAELSVKLGSAAETARELAYRLFTLCERKKRAAEALSYNALVQSWPEVSRLAQTSRPEQARQQTLDFDGE